jgi:NCAIR mutase (PurE)-related protein
MDRNTLKGILTKVKEGELDVEKALDALKDVPFKDLDFAKLDYHRAIRVGYPEVVFTEGKDINHLRGILLDMINRDANVLATRMSKEVYERVKDISENMVYHELARILIVNPKDVEKVGKVAVVTGGTADIPVAEEAAVTLEAFGNNVVRIFDVGVAGIHRLFSNMDKIKGSSCIVAVAGMEGALPSVLAGLVDVPVIAVPTSVGYGANFKGLSALLTMLNSCAAGISVVNIDNGFGAGYIASMINKGFFRNGVVK